MEDARLDWLPIKVTPSAALPGRWLVLLGMSVVNSPWVPRLFVGILAVIAYGRTLTAPFIWDDWSLVVNNPLVHSWRHLGEIFQTGPFGLSLSLDRYYRPLQSISFLIDWTIWKANPFGFHLTNVLLHGLNAALVWILLGRLTAPRSIAALGAALIFAVHPVNTEVVAYVGSRGDVLAATFGLLCLVSFASPRRERVSRLDTKARAGVDPNAKAAVRAGVKALWSSVPVASGLLLAALLTKEHLVVLPVLAAFLHRALPLEDADRRRQIIWVWSAIGAIYIVARLLLLQSNETRPLAAILDATGTHRLFTAIRAVATYVRLLCWPSQLHMDYQFVQTSMPWGHFAVAVLATGSLVAWVVHDPHRRRVRSALFAWFIVSLAPFLHLVTPLAQPMSERWLYWPSIGFFGLVCEVFANATRLARRVPTRWGNGELRPSPGNGELPLGSANVTGGIRTVVDHWIWTIAFAGLLIVCLWLTDRRNRDWADPAQLYAHDAALEPASFLLQNNLGVVQMQRGDSSAAETSFRRSIAASGERYGRAFNNLGEILEARGQIEEAADHYYRAITLSSDAVAYANLGRLSLAQGHVDQGREVLEEGARQSSDPAILYWLCWARLRSGDEAGAGEVYARLQDLGITDTEDMRTLARALRGH